MQYSFVQDMFLIHSSHVRSGHAWTNMVTAVKFKDTKNNNPRTANLHTTTQELLTCIRYTVYAFVVHVIVNILICSARRFDKQCLGRRPHTGPRCFL